MPRRPRPRALAEDDLARLTFLGAVGGVTGSSYLLETRRARVLVECGLFQGGRGAGAKNRARFPFPARGEGAPDALLLTHAHVDHSGRLPRLVREGWRGPVRTTRASADLLGVMLPDSAHVNAMDARSESRRRLRRGKDPVEPLYELEDAERALGLVEPVPFDERFAVAEGVEARFRRAGHILGAASIELWVGEGGFERKIVFSGDVGRTLSPGLRLPEPPEEADLALLESTYGDRDHAPRERSIEELAEVLRAAAGTGGNVIVPVFAVGRAQEVLWHIGELERAERIPSPRVYLDSPMAIDVAELYLRHPDCFQEPLREKLAEGGRALVPRRFEMVESPDESKALNDARGIVVLSASGMCEGGRVVHHLKHNLWRPEAHVVIVGFQARGTVGRAIVDGARSVRLLGEQIAVKAKVHTIGGFSAHAGQTELVEWVRALAASGAELALTHGEDDRREALAAKLRPLLRRPAVLPQERDFATLRRRGPPVVWSEGAGSARAVVERPRGRHDRPPVTGRER